MENFIDPQEQLYILPGLDFAMINKLKVKFGHERIAFWHFRQFTEICDFILENDINNENLLSKDAKKRLINRFSTFIKEHPL